MPVSWPEILIVFYHRSFIAVYMAVSKGREVVWTSELGSATASHDFVGMQPHVYSGGAVIECAIVLISRRAAAPSTQRETLAKCH